MKVLIAALIGGLAAWLAWSERARQDVVRRLSAARAPAQQAARTAASAAAERAERVAEAASVPRPVADVARRAATSVRSAAGPPGGAGTAPAGGAATVQVQELPDGSWIGNVAWGGRTLSDGAPDPDVVARRLAARLVALPGSGRLDYVTLIRVWKDGRREEREADLTSLLP
jgi:hypothetical protein